MPARGAAGNWGCSVLAFPLQLLLSPALAPSHTPQDKCTNAGHSTSPDFTSGQASPSARNSLPSYNLLICVGGRFSAFFFWSSKAWLCSLIKETKFYLEILPELQYFLFNEKENLILTVWFRLECGTDTLQYTACGVFLQPHKFSDVPR